MQLAGCRYDAYMTGAVFACLLPLLAAAADPEPAPVEAAAAALPPLMPKPNLALGTALKKALRGRPGDGAQPAGATAGEADTATPMAVEAAGVSEEAPDSEMKDASEAAAELARGVAAGDAGAMQRLQEAARRLRELPPAAPSLQPVQVGCKHKNPKTIKPLLGASYGTLSKHAGCALHQVGKCPNIGMQQMGVCIICCAPS